MNKNNLKKDFNLFGHRNLTITKILGIKNQIKYCNKIIRI